MLKKRTMALCKRRPNPQKTLSPYRQKERRYSQTQEVSVNKRSRYDQNFLMFSQTNTIWNWPFAALENIDLEWSSRVYLLKFWGIHIDLCELMKTEWDDLVSHVMTEHQYVVKSLHGVTHKIQVNSSNVLDWGFGWSKAHVRMSILQLYFLLWSTFSIAIVASWNPHCVDSGCCINYVWLSNCYSELLRVNLSFQSFPLGSANTQVENNFMNVQLDRKTMQALRLRADGTPKRKYTRRNPAPLKGNTDGEADANGQSAQPTRGSINCLRY